VKAGAYNIHLMSAANAGGIGYGNPASMLTATA
jgi:hypothetical protein